MKYYEANQLLAQVREEYPTLFSGTTYSQSEKTWVVHIGPDPHRYHVQSPLDWEMFKVVHLNPYPELPGEWRYTPKRETEQQTKGDQIPVPSRIMLRVLKRMPHSLSHFIWTKLLVPPFMGLTTTLRTLSSWGMPDSLLRRLINISWYIPLYPVFVDGLMKADAIAQAMAPVIMRNVRRVQEGQGLEEETEHIVPMPGGGHIHMLRIDDADELSPEEIMERVMAQVNEIMADHQPPADE